jgi:chromosome segregation ATPase
LQEQDSPNSLFSFAIDISDDEGDEASFSKAIGITSADIKTKLEDLLALLHQDTAQLVDDSDLAKVIFKILRGQILADTEEILFQAAHLESRQLQYQKATKRIANRAAYAQLKEEMLQVKHAADEKHKNISVLQSSGAELKQRISNLSAEREALLAELKQVEEALTQAQQEESQLPDVLNVLQQERNVQARKPLHMKKKLKPVEGSADEGTQEIEEANQIRLRAISAIQTLLNQ